MNSDGAAIFTLHRGTAPLVVSVPHAGTRLPEALKARLVPAAHAVPDTDWHLDTLYAFARDELGASFIVPLHSRYVVDLNRPPENTPMYPGVNNTELVPTRAFTGEPLYREGELPGEAEIAARRDAYWRPYHEALAAELARVRALHGHVVLWDGHSIAGELPWLFPGRLPDLNLGTASGASCAGTLRSALMRVLAAQATFTHVTDGRFKGGHITRHFGRPAERVHAVQLEMCWSTYMEERAPYALAPARAAMLAPVLRALLAACLDWKPDA
ncbi:MAG: N-formylglutamate deformylase [Rubrivivax sp.]|nr:N-formylglutamate deformylase [Rubrivivax sp.]